MKKHIQNHLKQILQHLYINPLEKCNLHCKICYTRKTDPILTEMEIVAFVKKYQKTQLLKIITFCGGEVFTLKYFSTLVNYLTKMGIFIQIITNGTIDRLKEFDNPNSINLIVSIDGLKKYHNQNRGEGTFQKSITFLNYAKKMGFHTEIFSIVTKQNFKMINDFEKYIKKEIGEVPVTYHPRKPPTYLTVHPISNVVGLIENFDYPTTEQLNKLYKTKIVFPPKDLGCYQVALMSDGKIYGCCEGTVPIGNIKNSIPKLINNLTQRLKIWQNKNPNSLCLGCSQPNFICGLIKVMSLRSRRV